jgi:2-amino-1-hydroxyethylphosphonate dioxygenase (glycine-forming)
MLKQTTAQKADQIIALYEQHGSDIYFGEAVTQLQHASQAAHQAHTEGYADDIQLAAFLHDIGHLIADAEPMGDLGVMNHEQVGADWLRSLDFSDTVCKLIAAHVAAKRYLTFANPRYYDNLSEASKKTLEFQGGRMSAAEAARFEDDPLFNLYIRMRLWDEAAKELIAPQTDWASALRSKIEADLNLNH